MKWQDVSNYNVQLPFQVIYDCKVKCPNCSFLSVSSKMNPKRDIEWGADKFIASLNNFKILFKSGCLKKIAYWSVEITIMKSVTWFKKIFSFKGFD